MHMHKISGRPEAYDDAPRSRPHLIDGQEQHEHSEIGIAQRECNALTARRGISNATKRAPWALVIKRAIDILVASIGLLLLAPVLVSIAIMVKLQDGGPVLYRRRVVGPEGPFDALKFRSMCPNADALLNQNPSLRRKFQANFKLKSDPRITRIGARLRKYSLDELPQLFNVLIGQMSLVGPRIITAEELSKYGQYHPLLLSVKPGLTGYWQVNGRQDVDYERRVAMDVYYIEHWSLRLELLILLRTPRKVLKGEGAL
jgi:lipopolysaccharide/colanic/teichoic acid biosynthesis glycosyltransferase